MMSGVKAVSDNQLRPRHQKKSPVSEEYQGAGQQPSDVKVAGADVDDRRDRVDLSPEAKKILEQGRAANTDDQ